MKKNTRLCWILCMMSVVALLISSCSIFRKSREEVTEVPIPTPEIVEIPVMPPPPTPTVAKPGEEGQIPPMIRPGPTKEAEGILKVIYFDFDSYSLLPDQKDAIGHNMTYLIEHPGERVLIEGHCDKRGTIKYNFGLGERRANSIRNYMISRGVEGNRIAIMSKGELEPVDPGNTEEAYSKNRRCEFKFLE